MDGSPGPLAVRDDPVMRASIWDMPPGWRWVLWGLGAARTVFTLDLVVPVRAQTRTHYTCVLCRVWRTDRSFLAYKWQTFQDTAFTDWYLAHRPAHVHQWGRSSCSWGGSLFGQICYVSCSRGHPVWSLSPDAEKAFAEKADPASLDAFFRGIASNNPGEQEQALQAALECLGREDGS